MLHYTVNQCPHWLADSMVTLGEPGMARCREMSTLPAGYILQRKVPSRAAVGHWFHCVSAVL